MRKAARKVYDNSFSIYKFGDRLEFEVSKTIDKFKQDLYNILVKSAILSKIAELVTLRKLFTRKIALIVY